MFMTVGQAWVCMDTNKDGTLTVDELPPGASVSEITYHEFHEYVRMDSDNFMHGMPDADEAMEVMRWTEIILQWLPEGTEAPLWMNTTVRTPATQARGPNTLWTAGLSLLNLGGEPSSDASSGYGQVRELFTFGSPAIVKGGFLKNPARADGCFPGLRVYTRGSHRNPDFEVRFYVADPIAWLFTGMGFSHPEMAVLSVDDDNTLHSGYSECTDGWNGPKADLFFWFDGHGQGRYHRVIQELNGLLGTWKFHDEIPENDIGATEVKGLVESLSPLCSAHPECAGLFPSDGNATCCPDPFGTTRACCTEFVEADEKFDVDLPYKVGDFVRVTTNITLLQEAFKQVVYSYRDSMENMLGQVFPVSRVSSPGIVGLPSDDGSDGGIWYFPVGTLQAVPPEVSNAMMPAASTARRLQGGKKDAIAKSAAYQQLAVIAYQDGDMGQTEDSEDLGFKMVSHTMIPRNATGVTAQMSLFQDPETKECVLAVATRRPKGMRASAMYILHPDYFADKPIMGRGLFTYLEMLAGFLPHRDQGKEIYTFGKLRGNYLYRGPVQEKIIEGIGCVLYTPAGRTLCPPNETEYLAEKAPTRMAWTSDWCGIKEIQGYMADSMRAFTASEEYKEGIAAKLTSCSSVTATGHDLGGALASLWTACANARLQEGQPGYEEWARVAWKVDGSTPEELQAFVPTPAEEKDLYLLKNTKTGKVMNLEGTLETVRAGLGTLQVADVGADGLDQKWELTPEGLLRNKHSQRCLGVSGKLGSSNPDDNWNLPTNIQECQYGLVNTAQSWNFTMQGMLVNQYTGLCLSAGMKLTMCPLSDQTWHLRSDGFIVNQLSGHCLDISGNPGTENGDMVVLWPCEYDNEDTDQRWEYTQQGLLKNLKSGKCLDAQHINGASIFHVTHLVLWDCVETLAAPIGQVWDMDDDGFIINRMTGKCVDIVGRHNTKPGTSLALETCSKFLDGRSTNLWELMTDGTILNRGNFARLSGHCLGATADGTAPEMQSCSTNQRQRFVVSQDGEVKPGLGLDMCVGSEGGAVGVFPCGRGANQTEDQWYLSAEGFLINRRTSLCVGLGDDEKTLREGHCLMTDQTWSIEAGGQIKNLLSGRCLDVQGGPPLDLQAGAKAELWACHATVTGSDQAWELVAGRIKSILSGKCLGVDGQPVNGAALVLAECDESGNSQQFMQAEGGFLKHVPSGKCVDVDGFAGHADGQQILLYDCEEGGHWTDQTWELVAASATTTFAAAGALRPPAGFRPALEGNGAATPLQQAMEDGAVQAAGEFVSSGKEVFWLYRGYKHLVQPTNDCSHCGCKFRIVAVDQSQLDATASGNDYDCTLQTMADVLEGFGSQGAPVVNSEASALELRPDVGRYVSAGRNVYWEYNGRKHEVAPGIGCEKCGCDQNTVLISQEELDAKPIGSNFQCEMTGIASYGATFLK